MPTADLLAAWGDNIQTRRLHVGLTQEQLAAELKVSVNSVRAWEQGRDEPRTTKKVAIAYALGVDNMADLFPWPGVTTSA